MEIQVNQKALAITIRQLGKRNDIFYSVWAKFKVDSNGVPFFGIGNNGDKWFTHKGDDFTSVSRDDVQKFYDQLGELLNKN